MKTSVVCITFIAIVFLCSIAVVTAQEYSIGPEDVLSITFWQQPNLDTSVRVSQNGTIALPVVGTITAAGMSPSELATKIVQRIAVFNKNVSQASVIVTEYGSKTIYVTGHVLRPGKYSFEKVPNLWKIILEAGGPSETALLNSVKIIQGQSGNSISVNVEDYLAEGDLDKLPPVHPGDTIKIPGVLTENGGAEMGGAGGIIPAQVDENLVYIYGQVARPGGYRFSRNLSVLEAIVIAGGPTIAAKLDEVKVIMHGGPYSSVATIDLENYAEEGNNKPITLQAGDTIFIPQQKPSKFWQVFQKGLLYDILRLVVTVSTSFVIYYSIRR